MSDLILLAILLDGPQHGYALKKRAGLILGQREMHNNTVYPLLNHFVEQGWVKRKEAEGERGQTRQVYSLTSSGRRQLVERLSTFEEDQARSGHEFQLRVSLFQLLPAAVREKVLRARIAVLERRREHLQRLQQAEQLSGFNAEVVAFNRRQAEAELEWIRKLSRMRTHV